MYSDSESGGRLLGPFEARGQSFSQTDILLVWALPKLELKQPLAFNWQLKQNPNLDPTLPRDHNPNLGFQI